MDGQETERWQDVWIGIKDEWRQIDEVEVIWIGELKNGWVNKS